MKRLWIGLLLLILLLPYGCGDLSLSTAEEEPVTMLKIDSLENGITTPLDKMLTFAISSFGSSEKQYDITAVLLDKNDNQIGTYTEQAIQNNIDYQLDLSNQTLTPGQYKLNFKVWDPVDKVIIEEKEIIFFYSRDFYDITGIESYPPVIFPQISVQLKGDLNVPPGANPYLRWMQNNTFLKSGLLSDGLDKIEWTAPAEEGVYPISLELFPFTPDNYEDYTFNSAIKMDVELYVSTSRKPSHQNLVPEDSYLTLFHFAGSLEGTAAQNYKSSGNTRLIEAIPLGAPQSVVTNNDLGYKLKKGDGFIIEAAEFPVSENRLMPFTLSLGGEFFPDQNEGTIFTHTTGGLQLTIGISEDKEITGIINYDNKETIIQSEIFLSDLNGRTLLSLSVLPSETATVFFWYNNADQVSFKNLPIIIENIDQTGKAVIGGEEGFEGVIDEWGIYYKTEESEPALFNELLEYILKIEHNRELAYAEGFDGVELNKEYVTSGKVNFTPGFAHITEDSQLTTPELPFNSEILNITLSMLVKQGFSGEIKLNFPAIKTLVERISIENRVTSPAQDKIERLLVNIVINKDKNILSVTINNKNIIEKDIKDFFISDIDTVQLELINNSPENLIVDSLSAVKSL